MKQLKYFITVAAVFVCFACQAQPDTTSSSKNSSLKTPEQLVDSARQRDIIDILRKVFGKSNPNDRKQPKKLIFSVVPAFGYSLSTGFAVDLSGNVAFYIGKSHKDNLSKIDAELVYDTRGQKILISRSELWADANNYKLVTDLRWESYPTDTYGLGSGTSSSKADHLNYLYARTYITLFKKIIPDYYAGVGYNLDYHYNINEAGNMDKSVSDYDKYGYASHSTSSGINLDLLFDNRRNPINPLNGGYAAVFYRDNFSFLGSDSHWQELQFDFRKYFRPSSQSANILAFWSILRFTNGNVPYLDLPATGADMYNNSGRGYTEGRFRGKNMIYLEGEYRFGITRNGLLGGVAFTNAESFSDFQTNRFKNVAPAAGTGLRIKINKHSDTNICIDYAYGLYGSHGFFVNLGEVF